MMRKTPSRTAQGRFERASQNVYAIVESQVVAVASPKYLNKQPTAVATRTPPRITMTDLFASVCFIYFVDQLSNEL